MGGDFRKILPDIPKVDRAKIVDVAINTSHLWNECKFLRLTKNMRLQSSSDLEEQEKIKSFFKWLLKLGDGKIGLPHDGIKDITIRTELLPCDESNPVKSIVESTFPNLVERIAEENYLTNKVILTPTTENVDILNDYICSLLPGDAIEYFNSNFISRTDNANESFRDMYNVEFLNSIRCSEIPHHKLIFKVGIPIILIRNVDQAVGFCNGTRLRIKYLGKNFIRVNVLNGKSVGEDILIHSMDMNPFKSKLPFNMARRQFLIINSFAMTIIKSQDQSMFSVGLYLPSPVFSYDQLYVALSRVKSFNGLKLWILDEQKKCIN